MPQYITNTMRICTKDALNAKYDATVPVKPIYNAATNVTSSSSSSSTLPHFEDEEYCSDSPFDVPWSLDDAAKADNPAAMFSVGNVPMWDGVSFASSEQDWFTSSRKYPFESHIAQLVNTNPGVSSMHGWTDGGDEASCAQLLTDQEELLQCTTDADCQPLVPSTKLQCHYGICVMDMKQYPSCYAHRDCQVRFCCFAVISLWFLLAHATSKA